MVAINFQKQFAEKVKVGAKRQTIRSKNRFKVGDKLQLYYGQRTKHCEKLADAECIAVKEITIGESSIAFVDSNRCKVMWNNSLEEFARADGFTHWEHMRDWFKEKYTLPFDGYLIEWELVDNGN